jgi:hypothetical protein
MEIKVDYIFADYIVVFSTLTLLNTVQEDQERVIDEWSVSKADIVVLLFTIKPFISTHAAIYFKASAFYGRVCDAGPTWCVVILMDDIPV